MSMATTTKAKLSSIVVGSRSGLRKLKLSQFLKYHWTLSSAQDDNAAAAPVEKALSDTEASEKSETEKLPPVMPELIADKSE